MYKLEKQNSLPLFVIDEHNEGVANVWDVKNQKFVRFCDVGVATFTSLLMKMFFSYECLT